MPERDNTGSTARRVQVRVELMETSQPIVIDAVNTYTKGPFYCVYDGTTVQKFPVANVWRVTEGYRAG